MIISKTPFRISLFGGGTDFEEYFIKDGGAVIGMTINKYCYISIRKLPPFFKHKHRFVWSKIELIKDVKKIIHPTTKAIFNYYKPKDGLEIHYDGDLPGNSGIGSSSAFTAGSINALSNLYDKNYPKKELAKKTIFIEKNIMKENNGYQDQIWATYGGLNTIEFNKNKTFKVTKVKISEKNKQNLQNKLIMFFVGKHRFSNNIEKDKQTKIDKNLRFYQQIKKQVYECKKELESQNLNFNFLGDLLNDYWNLKKNLSNKVSSHTIESIYQEGLNAGALGGKLLGAGGGGFFLFLTNDKNKLKKRLNKLIPVEIEIESKGSKIIYKDA